ncbi:hypothetical protein ASPCAL13939 [Aspergillus calidoustus]|uniref:Uncharacterized protein n=1 Tax=Aspergillus calidoustus TaxID=454130 RepID=A0A0U5GJ37_ASPCI|nr:hypothetical protein ASPCAL13939 [Aspergillus calidoustus]
MRLLAILSIACSASAWTFTWTDKDGQSYIEHSDDPVSCKQIQQAEGEKFRWVPEEDGLSIWLYENGKCEGRQAGYSPPTVWDHVSSRDLLSFRVADGDGGDDTSTATTSTTTTTSTSTASTASTSSSTEASESPTTTTTTDTTPTPSTSETPSSEPSNSDNSSSSAGPIAGGVVGGVAGLAAIGGLFFFLGRRRRSNHSQLEPQESGPNDDRPDTAATTSSPSQATPMYGGVAAGSSTHYDPSFIEGKPELDSAPVHQVVSPIEQPISSTKQGPSPFDDSATVSHRPPARMMAELPGDSVMMVEMSDSHRLNELEGDGMPKKW